MAYELKTKQNNASVESYLSEIESPTRQSDCRTVCALMQEISGEPPKMWGTAIVGFGTAPYVYASGQSGDWPVCAFSSRKQNLTLYIGSKEELAPHLAKLGPHKAGVSCLYIKRLSDIDLSVLRTIIIECVKRYTPKHEVS